MATQMLEECLCESPRGLPWWKCELLQLSVLVCTTELCLLILQAFCIVVTFYFVIFSQFSNLCYYWVGWYFLKNYYLFYLGEEKSRSTTTTTFFLLKIIYCFKTLKTTPSSSETSAQVLKYPKSTNYLQIGLWQQHSSSCGRLLWITQDYLKSKQAALAGGVTE